MAPNDDGPLELPAGDEPEPRQPLGSFRRPTSTTGWRSWITTVDHKKIGIMYGATALVFLGIGGLEALMIRAQLAQPNGQVLSPEAYNQAFTMHGTTMVFFVIMPLLAAFSNYLIPLQIGARDVAFPRLNALSYWIFLFAGLFVYSGVILHAIPDNGWFNYAPNSGLAYSPGHGIDFWDLGLQIAGIASLVGAV
ncbi:MAG: putative cytochrome c oxidase subunit I/subunit, partial [Actinomycetia bacterium]|nr:putative cytochrome c oxidase subunit I/subunit [Actinomycetes bacterium]